MGKKLYNLCEFGKSELKFLNKEQIDIMMFYVEFNWDVQELPNAKNTCRTE